MTNEGLKDFINKVSELDDIANGVYTLIPDEQSPNYNFRAIDLYCKEKGISPYELSDGELEKFIIK